MNLFLFYLKLNFLFYIKKLNLFIIKKKLRTKRNYIKAYNNNI